jgi:hypothetical protein
MPSVLEIIEQRPQKAGWSEEVVDRLQSIAG